MTEDAECAWGRVLTHPAILEPCPAPPTHVLVLTDVAVAVRLCAEHNDVLAVAGLSQPAPPEWEDSRD